MMTLSPKGLAFIKQMEGCRLVPYQDQAGVWTVGVGHTGHDVIPGKAITQADAEHLLECDSGRFADALNRLITVPLTQNQFDALVSFAFNVGIAAFSRSTLRAVVNKGDHEDVPAQLLRWNKAGGKVSSGLVRRRQAESHLYQGV